MLSSETALFEDSPGQLTDLSSETALFEDRTARGEGREVDYVVGWFQISLENIIFEENF